MRVVALERGYHGQLREPGDEFDVPEGAKGRWFKAIEPASVERPVPATEGDDADIA